MISLQFFFQDTQWALLYVFAFFAFVLIFYYWFFYSRVAFCKVKPNTSPKTLPPVSVIICVKNEFENLKNNLPSILGQDYPDFEVILVNDYSEDDSFFLLKSYQEKYPHLNVINLRENVNFFAGKKLALAVGIKSARNPVILLTDADCKAASRNWISHMAGIFDVKTEVVLGYGGYKKLSGFINWLIRFDTVSIAIQYMSFASAGIPYMGVGRNLAYKKELFYKVGGFTAHYKIKSGDDDLFINKAAGSKNTRVALHPDSFTISEPKKNFSAWFKQKKRHLSTSRYYKFSDKFLLGLYGLSHTFFYISFVVFLLFAQWSLSLWIALAIMGVKILSLLMVHYYAGKKYLEPKLFLYSPMFDVIFAFLNPIFALSNLFYRKNKWK